MKTFMDIAANATPLELHNYPGRGFQHMTLARWRSLPSSCKGSWLEGAREHGQGPHRVRIALTPDAGLLPVFLVDEERRDPRPASPAPVAA
ncbi:hypothetical protein QTH87_16820 [Variovorax sp. J22P168]|uniref:hypothetical protein n=1 Tax=Variovorax jilinensis TaxID=3053513 RepID=UPI00257734B1|nr:hypothetical protein [Variovorax sp. J22P168]MDM0014102.1 hypothetical protein [Variovorax sp. J22P168]